MTTAGATTAEDRDDLSFYSRDAAAGNVDNPGILFGTTAIVEMFEPSLGVETAGPYVVYILQPAAGYDDSEVVPEDMLAREDAGVFVLYLRPSTSATRRGVEACIDQALARRQTKDRDREMAGSYMFDLLGRVLTQPISCSEASAAEPRGIRVASGGYSTAVEGSPTIRAIASPATFATDDDRYRWLNNVVAVGEGTIDFRTLRLRMQYYAVLTEVT